jgi:hypothetical protein
MLELWLRPVLALLSVYLLAHFAMVLMAIFRSLVLCEIVKRFVFLTEYALLHTLVYIQDL